MRTDSEKDHQRIVQTILASIRECLENSGNRGPLGLMIAGRFHESAEKVLTAELLGFGQRVRCARVFRSREELSIWQSLLGDSEIEPGLLLLEQDITAQRTGAGEFDLAIMLEADSESGRKEEILRRANRAPGEAALLGGVVDLLRRQAGDKVGDQIVNNVRRGRRDYRRVLVFGVPEIAGHAVAVEQVSQLPDISRIEPTRY